MIFKLHKYFDEVCVTFRTPCTTSHEEHLLELEVCVFLKCNIKECPWLHSSCVFYLRRLPSLATRRQRSDSVRHMNTFVCSGRHIHDTQPWQRTREISSKKCWCAGMATITHGAKRQSKNIINGLLPAATHCPSLSLEGWMWQHCLARCQICKVHGA